MRRKLLSLRRDRSGAVAMVFTLSLPVLVGGAALAIDGSLLYVHRNQLQIAADASALAGAMVIGTGDVTATAVAMADANLAYRGAGGGDTDGDDQKDKDKDKNKDKGNRGSAQAVDDGTGGGSVLPAADVVTGVWNAGTKTFTPGGTPVNAVRTTTRMTTANGNPAAFFLAPILGVRTADVAATSIALQTTDDRCTLYLPPQSGSPPSKTGVVTLGEGTPARYLKDHGLPIVRVDNNLVGENIVVIKNTSPSPLRYVTYKLPYRGKFYFVWPHEGPASGNLVLVVHSSSPGGNHNSGTATWNNNIRTVDNAPRTCITREPVAGGAPRSGLVG